MRAEWEDCVDHDLVIAATDQADEESDGSDIPYSGIQFH